MTHTASVAVVIPLYNKRAFVRAAVDSVLAQDFREYELIIVDDGSTDNGVETLADIDDHRMRIVSQANSGVAAARNRGIAEARADWIALLDADDLWKSGHLGQIAAMASSFPQAGIVATTVQQVRAGVLLDRDQTGPVTIREIDYFGEAAANILIVHTSATALRRDAVDRIGGFQDLRPGQDIDCWSRMALNWPVIKSSRQTVLYSRDTGGAMNSWSASRKSRSDIVTLEDFGGAIASLARALDSGAHEQNRRSIERYIDARILSGVGRCIAAGDTANARRRLKFVRHRSPRKLAMELLAGLPTPLFRLAATAYRRVRR